MAVLPLRREHFEIAIICVLEIEGNAVEALFTETFSGLGKAEHDENFYVTGLLGGKPVVLVAPRNMGVLNAADAANHMRLSFTKIRLALVTGVAGGAPHTPKGEEILLGDVLISTQVLQSDFGRMYAGGLKIREGPADGLGPPKQELANFLKYLQRDKCVQNLTQRINEGIAEEKLAEFSYPGHGNDHLFPRGYPHRHRGDHVTCKCKDCLTADDAVCGTAQESRCAALQCDAGQCVLRERVRDCVEPTDTASGLSQQQLLQRQRTDLSSGPALPAHIHFGTIASSSQVLKSSTVRDELARVRDVIGFEMEGAGCWGVFPTLVVKSVCDYADGHKDKQWQPYANAMAACCAREIVEKWQSSQIMAVRLPIPYGRGLGSADASSTSQVAHHYVTPEGLAVQNAILRGLFVTNPSDDLYAVKERIRNGLGHAPGTCEWIEYHECFRNWLDRPTPQILSLVGPPGIGKSTLSTAILSLLQHEVPGHPRSDLAFFFCDAARDNSRTYLSVVKSLLRQILKQGLEMLPMELVDDYQMQGSALFTNVPALSRHLFTVLHRVPGEVRILVDGLDEIEDSSRSDVFQMFARLCRGPPRDTRPDVRIILTHHSGRFPNYANQLPELFQIIDIDQEWEVRRDVNRYIDADVSELSATLDWDEETTKDVKRKLQEKSSGTFLWAALALRSLQNARPDNVLERLEDLPPGLDAMYERLLRDIPHRERPTAAFALHCVVVNVPYLTEITLGALLASQGVAKSGNHFPAARRIRQLRTTWKSCRAFLRVQPYCSIGSLGSIHRSVEYFFQEKGLPEDLVIFRFDRAHVLSQVEKKCEDYLASPEMLRMKADIQKTMDGGRFALSDIWKIFENIEHFEFLRFCERNVRRNSRTLQLIELESTSSADNALVVRSERDAFWQGVRKLSQRHAVDYEPGLFELIERASLQLSEIAIATKQPGLVNVLEAVSQGWWQRYFGLEPFFSEYYDVSSSNREQEPAMQSVARVLSDFVSSGFLGFARTLTSHIGFDNNPHYHWHPQSPLCAMIVKTLMGSGHVHSAKRFMQDTRSQIASDMNWTYLHCMAEFNVTSAIRVLLVAGDDPSLVDIDGTNPLQVAAEFNSFESLKLLLEVMPLSVLADSRFMTKLLFSTVEGECSRGLRLLLGKSRVLFDLDEWCWGELICWAASNDSDECLKVVLEAGLTCINCGEFKGRTGLHWASRLCHVANVELLMQYGANATIRDDEGMLAIELAIHHHNDLRIRSATQVRRMAEVMWPFLTPEVLQKNDSMNTLLRAAAKYGMATWAEDCLRWRADVEVVDCYGRTLLHHAAIGGSGEVVRLLLQSGLSLETLWVRDPYRTWMQTPLHHAVFQGHVEAVRVLVEADPLGKSLHITDCASMTPLGFVREMQGLDAQLAVRKLIDEYRYNYRIRGHALPKLKWIWTELKPKYREIVKILEEAHARFDGQHCINVESGDESDYWDQYVSECEDDEEPQSGDGDDDKSDGDEDQQEEEHEDRHGEEHEDEQSGFASHGPKRRRLK